MSTLNEILNKLEKYKNDNDEYVKAYLFWTNNMKDIIKGQVFEMLNNTDNLTKISHSDLKSLIYSDNGRDKHTYKVWPMNHGMIGFEFDMPTKSHSYHTDGYANHGEFCKGYINVTNGKYKFNYSYHVDNDYWDADSYEGIYDINSSTSKLGQCFKIIKQYKKSGKTLYVDFIESICEELANAIENNQLDDMEIAKLFSYRLYKEVNFTYESAIFEEDNILYISDCYNLDANRLKLYEVKILDASDWKAVHVLFKFKGENCTWLPAKFNIDDNTYMILIELKYSIKTLLSELNFKYFNKDY